MASLRSTKMTRPSDGGVCFCCLRRDEGVGFFVGHNPPRIIWACEEHILIGKKTATMSQRDFDVYEKQALNEAGAKAGKFLDRIGKTDLATLELHEWLAFCKTLVVGFGDELGKRLANDEAPF